MTWQKRWVVCPPDYIPVFEYAGVPGYCYRLKREACPVGNPVQCAGGQKMQTEEDIAPTATSTLGFKRYYSSSGFYTSPSAERERKELGTKWRHNWQSHVVVESGAGPNVLAYVVRPDGDYRHFRVDGAVWAGRQDKPDTLQEQIVGGVRTGWVYQAEDDAIHYYDAEGRWLSLERAGQTTTLIYSDASTSSFIAPEPGLLIAITDPHGHRLEFRYDTAGFLSQAIAPDGKIHDYRYATRTINGATANLGLLAYVDRPEGTTREYIYDEPSHTATASYGELLTGIIDESNQRLSTYQYDSSSRVVHEWHGTASAGRMDLTYTGNYNSATSQTRITDAGGQILRRRFVAVNGIVRDAGTDRCANANCTSVTSSTTIIYDANGNRESSTDFNGWATEYDYNTRGLQTERTEAANATDGTTRSFQTDWHATWNVPIERRTRDAQNALVALERIAYNARGQVTARCTIDPASPNANYACGSQAHAPAGVRQSRTVYCDAENLTPSDPIGAGENLAKGCPLVGLVRRIDGPRTDVADIATYEYRLADAPGCDTSPATCAWRKGDLWKTTNALGHATEIVAYDGAGRVLKSIDANDVITQFTYHPRGWLASRTVKGATTGEDAITTFTYTATGEVSRISPPDGDFLDYEYDDAHRLVAIEDAAGNRIEYTLDAAGNRTAETTQDASAAVTRQLSRTYDLLNRLIEQRDAHNQPTSFTYDANGNQTGTEDALGIQSQQAFDPLDRLRQTVQDVGDIEAQTGFEYDPLDRLTRVTDPKGLDTGYAYDGLGNLTQLTSPDTGITTYAYDAAGNRSSQTDARGVTAAYSHDALNRLTAIAYPDSALNVTYHYDETNAVTGCATSFPKGRLTRMIDASGTTAYCHDRRGNVTRKRLTQGGQTYTIGYAHTRGDRLAAITYPDTTTLTYGRDALGQVATITQTGITPTRPIVTSATYRPFGPIAQIGFAGGTSQSFTYDNNHWPTAIAGTALNLSFGHDARGNIKRIEGITDAALSRDYAYDALSRLILSSLPPEGGETSRVSALLPLEHYVYDATGNRLSKEQNLPFLPSVYQAYGYPQGSHRLTGVGSQSRTYDAMGNLTARGSQAFGYGDDQRLKQFSPSSFSLPTTYIHNGKGERAIKQTDQIVIGEDGLLEYGYLYDEQGRLLAEYRTATSQLSRLYVWLDDRPIAVQPKAGSYANEWLHIHADHLGTPRAITRPSQANATIWRWSPTQTAFGEHAPEQDPDGDGDPFTFNLRYPGQYFDQESGLHYNYFRNYEPSTGRYVQSDPIGLAGGISTYGYVHGNPLMFVDPFGLKARVCCRKIPWLPAAHCFIEEDHDDIDDDFCGPPCETKKRTIGLQGPPPFGDSSNGGGQTFTNHGFDDPGQSKCGEWTTDCHLSKCLDRELADYANPSRYSGPRGPNSNTFAYTLMSRCGLSPPGRGWPKPGWGQDPAGSL
ncbi:MAG: DUF6531 domain-containing protein [Xanthomonadaceae bacterium]|nr:DUF6531 domain-containing protein [Xanthomonadaceae bacterium]